MFRLISVFIAERFKPYLPEKGLKTKRSINNA